MVPRGSHNILFWMVCSQWFDHNQWILVCFNEQSHRSSSKLLHYNPMHSSGLWSEDRPSKLKS